MLDHLVYAGRGLEHAVDGIERQVGVRPASGGTHGGGLTHNALVALGARSYLEVIARVPGIEAPSGALPFGLETLTEPRLVAWAVPVDDIEQRVEGARAAGYDPGEMIAGGRDIPDGCHLGWHLVVRTDTAGGWLRP